MPKGWFAGAYELLVSRLDRFSESTVDEDLPSLVVDDPPGRHRSDDARSRQVTQCGAGEEEPNDYDIGRDG